MRRHARDQMVSLASLDLREKLSEILHDKKNPLDYEDILIPICKTKAALLRVMQHPGSMLVTTSGPNSVNFKVYSVVKAALEGENAMTLIEVYDALCEYEINDCVKYMLRYERHGNYEKSAYEA